MAAKIALPIAGARARSLVRAIGLALSRPGFLFAGARASTGAFQGWSGREDDGAGDVAASCLGECLGGIGEAVAGGDRDLQLPVLELLREFAQLVSVRADVDAGDRDAALLAGRVGGDGRQPPAVGDCPDRAGGAAGVPRWPRRPLRGVRLSRGPVRANLGRGSR